MDSRDSGRHKLHKYGPDSFQQQHPTNTLPNMQFILVALAMIQAANAASLVDTLVQNKADVLVKLVTSVPAIADALSTFKGTLFAPTDDALTATVKAGFNPADLKAVANVLTYHAVSGTPYPSANAAETTFLTTLQGNPLEAIKSDKGVQILSAFGTPASNVIKSVAYDGGIVHFVDQTLIPPANVVEVAKAAKLNSLLAALTAAGLAETVAGLKDVTILAPTDEAFAAISSVAATLTIEQLQTVLLLHVIPSTIYSTDIVAAKSIDSVATASKGNNLSVKFDGTNVLIAGAANKSPAKVAAADVFADNVIVHVIDTVLLPKSEAPAAASPTTKAAVAPANTGLYKSGAAAQIVGGLMSLSALLIL
ncbi:Stabilin-2 [Chytriomyces hyalinus]|nr:Stabilin-2 [Chytriomyces hyalinus]